MATITRDQIVARVRRYAAQRNANQGLLDTDLHEMINDSCANYWDLLVSIRGHSYFETTSMFTMAPSVAAYELPDDFFQLSTVSLAWGGTDREDVPPLPSNRDLTAFTAADLSWERFTMKGYRVTGDQFGVKYITFYPTPSSAVQCELRYVPMFIPMTAGSGDDGKMEFENSWHKLVCLDVAAEFRGLLGLPADFLIQRRDEQRQRIMEMATERLQDDPAEIVDAERSVNRWYPYPRWSSS